MPEDMDIYMKKIKQRADETDNVMGKIKANKMAELDKLQLESEIVEVEAKLEANRAKIRESQQTGKALAPKQAYDFAELLFTGRPPEEIKQIIDSLDETALDKLAYLGAAMNGQQIGAFTQTLRRPETNVKDTIELINTVVKMNQRPTEQQGITLQGIAALMKEFREAQTPPAPQQNPLETMKTYHEMFLKPVLDQLNSKEKEIVTMRMNQIENKITAQVSPQEYIKQIKESANTLGLSNASRTEIDLKLAEMGQTERFENRKLDLEEKKWAYEQENSGKTMEQVTNLLKTVGEGPIGKAIENMGSGVGERLKTGKSNNAQQLIKIQCPNCYGQFAVNPALQSIQCPHCGAMLQAKPPTTQPQEPQPETPPVTQETQQQLDTHQTQELSQQESSQSEQTTDQPPAQ